MKARAQTAVETSFLFSAKINDRRRMKCRDF
jgi:hypothetical protein